MIDSKTIKKATIWSALETVTSFSLGIFSIIFLAKLLSPDDYGQIATAQLTSALIQIVLGFGLSDAIIQKKDMTERDVQTFWSFSCILAIIAFILCGSIGYIFYLNTKAILAYIMFFEGIVACLTILTMIPSAMAYRHLDIKKLTLLNIVARLFFFIVAIPLAILQFGLWSVVFGNLVQGVIYFLLIVITMQSFIPKKFSMDIKMLGHSLNFGFYVMLENLLWSVMSRVLGLLIATFHGSTALGLYNMATKFTDTILSILNMTITRLALPIFSAVQEDRAKLLSSFQKTTYYFNLLSMPAFFCMALTAKYWVVLLLGEKWLGVIPVVQVIAVMYGIMYGRMFVGTVIKSLGRSKEFLFLSVVAACITLIAVFTTHDTGLISTLLALSIPRVIITIPLGIYLMYKICQFNIVDQLKPLIIPIVLSTIMLACVLLIQHFCPDITWFNFILQIILASAVFIVLVWMLIKKNIGSDL